MSDILVIIDGMNDKYFDPSDYPALSTMKVNEGIDTTPPGYETETLNCVLNILGVKNIPQKLRSYVECCGADIIPDDDDLILRGTWVEIDPTGKTLGYSSWPDSLKYRSENIECYKINDYASIILIKHRSDLLEKIKCHLPHQNFGMASSDLMPEGFDELTKFIKENTFADRIMIPWAEAVVTKMDTDIKDLSVVCGKSLITGISKMLGFDVTVPSGANGDVDTDLKAKLDATLELAKTKDHILLHINGCDEAAHHKDLKEKREFLSQVDKIVLSELLKTDNRIKVVADHITDPDTGSHIGGLQPVLTNY